MHNRKEKERVRERGPHYYLDQPWLNEPIAHRTTIWLSLYYSYPTSTACVFFQDHRSLMSTMLTKKWVHTTHHHQGGHRVWPGISRPGTGKNTGWISKFGIFTRVRPGNGPGILPGVKSCFQILNNNNCDLYWIQKYQYIEISAFLSRYLFFIHKSRFNPQKLWNFVFLKKIWWIHGDKNMVFNSIEDQISDFFTCQYLKFNRTHLNLWNSYTKIPYFYNGSYKKIGVPQVPIQWVRRRLTLNASSFHCNAEY